MGDMMHDTAEQEEKIILVGVATAENDDTEQSLDELEELGQTAGTVTLAKVIQNREKVHSATYIGKGKIQEVKELVENAYNRAKELLKTHQDQHRQVAELLLEREVIFSDDLERILGKRPWKDDEEEETKEEKTVENEIKSL